MIGVVDYGAGNLRSLMNALDHLALPARVVASPADISSVDKLIVPGVGAFGSAASKCHETGFLPHIREWAEADRPFLGICLGMQLLLESSDESPDVEGIGFFSGTNRVFTEGTVPHMGWNAIFAGDDDPLFADVPEGAYCYFVHSYYAVPDDRTVVAAWTDYYVRFPAVLARGRVRGTQFHPEKSGETGLRILKNWGTIC